MADWEWPGRRWAGCKGRAAETGREQLHVKAEDGESGAAATRAAPGAENHLMATPVGHPCVQIAPFANAIEHPRAPLVVLSLAGRVRREKTASSGKQCGTWAPSGLSRYERQREKDKSLEIQAGIG